MEEVSKAYAWQEAIQLAKSLVRICEEFSDADTNVLVWHLRQAVVDIPASIAMDLKANRKASMEPVVKLATELELVRKVYPAIDTGKVGEQLAQLMERMENGKFDEREPDPEAEEDEADEAPAEAIPADVPELTPAAPPAPEPAKPMGGTVVAPQVGESKAPAERTLSVTTDEAVTSIQPSSNN